MHRPDLDQLRAHVDQIPAGPLRELVPQVLAYVEDLERLVRPLAHVGLPVPADQWSAPWRAIAAAVEEARRLLLRGEPFGGRSQQLGQRSMPRSVMRSSGATWAPRSRG